MPRAVGAAALAAALAAAALAAPAAAALEADGQVHELTASSFDAAIRRHELSFVEFYAPWCGHCQKLAPEWDRLAELARAAGIPVAKVDATSNKKLAEKHGVESFPTLKLYHSDPEVSKSYGGPRTADKMAEWAALWRGGPPLERPGASAAALRGWAGARRLAILGLLSGDDAADAAMRRALQAMAFVLNPRSPHSEVRVGEAVRTHAEARALLAELGVSEVSLAAPPCALLFRDFDLEDRVLALPPLKQSGWREAYSTYLAFFKAKQVPALIPAREDTQRFFLHDIDPGNGLVVYFGVDEGFRRDMHELATRFARPGARLKWVHAQGDDFGVSFAKSVKLSRGDFPEVVIWEFGETEESDKVHRMSEKLPGAALAKESVEALVAGWQAGWAPAAEGGSGRSAPGGAPKALAAAEPAAPAQHAGADASCTAGGAAAAWVFDDAAEPERRGEPLTEDMLQSRGGFTLVQVGDVGLLVPPGGQPGARAVRRFASLEAARAHAARLAAAPSFGGAAAQPGALAPPSAFPCPVGADLPSCHAWCEGVLALPPMQVAATLAGKPCAGAVPKALSDPPRCVCRASPGKDQPALAMCASPCAEGAAPGGLPAPLPGAGPAAASAGAAASGAPPAPAPAPPRYVLYDAKYGEGFNLQREVYPRAGWVVGRLNEALDARCGADQSGGCARWVLVLPPWCRVVHWWSGPARLPWSTFFDKEALFGSKVPVLEFEDYVRATGSASVDLAVVYQTDPLKEAARGALAGATGKFSGWAKDPGQCTETPAKQLKIFSGAAATLTYAGECEGGIRAKEVRCAVLDGPWPQGVVDMVGSLGREVSSVLVKSYDFLLSPENNELDDLGLRESMLFSPEIRQAGDSFVKSVLGGRPYLSAHCRRTDFLRVRTETTPSAGVIAAQLNKALEETGLGQVFVATDAPEDLREELRAEVRGAVHFYADAGAGPALDHPGKQAAAEIWIAARAEFFIGTQESRFTMAIQLERGFLGKRSATSEREFCKEDAGQQCTCPKYRHPRRKGAFREAYM